MKNGKKIRLRLFNDLKVFYGTIDYIELKSIYINIQSWVQPKDDYTNWKKIVCTQSRDIKHTILDVNDLNLFHKSTIVDLDIRHSGLSLDKKSFMNLEITLFAKVGVDFKSNELKESDRKIIKEIYNKNISKNKYFDFFITKRDLIQ
jgi:hypothetical protein